MARDFENPYVKDKTLEELIDDLGSVAEPHSSTWHVIRAAIEVKLAERLVTPKRWAGVALAAAVVSAAAAVISAVAAF